jgi:hypothetical protein
VKHILNCFFLSLVSCALVFAAPIPVPLTIQVTPPPPSPIQVQVSQSVTVGGVAYTVTGTLTFTPVVVTGSGIPPAPSVPVITGTAPVAGIIQGYQDLNHNWITRASEGDTVVMVGTGFGDAMGSVIDDTTIGVPVTRWSDTGLTIVLPHVAAQPHIPAVQVVSAKGLLLAWTNNGGLSIVPKS